jgi:crotonobetainyl-CoA:carnitine CoA-transferase CaiB-like acyl-CoA transferase
MAIEVSSTESNKAEAGPLGPPVLSGIKVLDLSQHYSGALAACLLADLGADVVAVEHPQGSPMRTMLPQKDGESLWWKVTARGKRVVTLNLSTPEGADLARQMASKVDVLIENFRPGTLERWGLGPEQLREHCDSLVMLRISGFGQTGPMRDRPGFGTAAEAMSGFAHLNGHPDESPMFPSTTLADGVAGTFGALGVLSLLVNQLRDPQPGVHVVDTALFETLFRIIPVHIAQYDQLGVAPKRPGNFLGSHGVLRNLYYTADRVYFAVSAIGEKTMRRILDAAGAGDLSLEVETVINAGDAVAFEAFLVRADAAVAAWAASMTWEYVSERLASSGAVFQRIYDAADIIDDPVYLAREDIVSVPDEKLGPIRMQGIVPKFPGRAHSVKHAGPSRGRHNTEVYRELLDLDTDAIDELHERGVI